ncbi:hypothetical protein Agub_g3280, partial [Astrephomene gubernaculifera]
MKSVNAASLSGKAPRTPVRSSRLPLFSNTRAAHSRDRRLTVRFFREGRDSQNPSASSPPATAHTNGVQSGVHVLQTAAPAPAVTTTPPNRVPSAVPPPPTPAPQPPGFHSRRLLVFSGLVLGYAAYYLTRNSLTYT